MYGFYSTLTFLMQKQMNLGGNIRLFGSPGNKVDIASMSSFSQDDLLKKCNSCRPVDIFIEIPIYVYVV